MPYPSDLTDKEWAILEPLLPKHPAKGQPWRYPLRVMVNAMFYVLRSGCAWRMLPHEYPPWETVYSRFRLWNRRGIWHQVLDVLRSRARELEGREPEPGSGEPLSAWAMMDCLGQKSTMRVRPPGDGNKQQKAPKYGGCICRTLPASC